MEFSQKMLLKKYTFILIVSNPKIYVFCFLLCLKASMFFSSPETFFQALPSLTPGKPENPASNSDQLSSVCCTTARFALSLPSAYKVPLAVICDCLVNVYYTDMKQENTLPSIPTNTELKQRHMKHLNYGHTGC